MTSTIRKSLSADFRSVYRLFLRTSSTAVLHQRQARKNLRERWRPVFDAGAKVIQELRNKPEDAPITWIQGREDRLKTWNERMDNTLALLYTASQSRGLPHKLSRNLAFMTANERERLLNKLAKTPRWNPSNPQIIKQHVKVNQVEIVQKRASKFVDEVTRMAEASGKLSLGRNQLVIRRVPRSWKAGST